MVTIAVGMVTAREQPETDQLENFVMVGELALSGATPPVGLLPPHHSSPPILDFIAFSTITSLSDRAQNLG
jgi:hypothetical protein